MSDHHGLGQDEVNYLVVRINLNKEKLPSPQQKFPGREGYYLALDSYLKEN